MDPNYIKRIEEDKKLWADCDKCGDEIRMCDVYWFNLSFAACKKCAHEIQDKIDAIICEYFLLKDDE